MKKEARENFGLDKVSIKFRFFPLMFFGSLPLKPLQVYQDTVRKSN